MRIFMFRNMKPIWHIYIFICFFGPILSTHFFIGLKMLSDIRIQIILLFITAFIAEYFYWKKDIGNLSKICLKYLLEEETKEEAKQKKDTL
jgi:hypothetical protein